MWIELSDNIIELGGQHRTTFKDQHVRFKHSGVCYTMYMILSRQRTNVAYCLHILGAANRYDDYAANCSLGSYIGVSARKKNTAHYMMCITWSNEPVGDCVCAFDACGCFNLCVMMSSGITCVAWSCRLQPTHIFIYTFALVTKRIIVNTLDI